MNKNIKESLHNYQLAKTNYRKTKKAHYAGKQIVSFK